MYLEKINGPADIKKLSVEQLNVLADETRHYLIEKVSNHGGHVGPNLGMVEATVALHYVFNSPVDKIVFDVSHQSYAHKILTGRKQAFMDPAHYNDVTGFSEPSESEHDHFVIGHTSTSISLACGLVKGRDLAGGKENVIAVIGDGSLSGGEALEGLSMAGSELNSNFIIIVNDNQMSIAENHGGLYKNLQLLRETNGKAEVNLFKAMGLEYVYVGDGNDVATLIDAFQKVKDTDKPVVVHINTLKGKGLSMPRRTRRNGISVVHSMWRPVSLNSKAQPRTTVILPENICWRRCSQILSLSPSLPARLPCSGSPSLAGYRLGNSSWTWESPRRPLWRWHPVSRNVEENLSGAFTAHSSREHTTNSHRISASMTTRP